MAILRSETKSISTVQKYALESEATKRFLFGSGSFDTDRAQLKSDITKIEKGEPPDWAVKIIEKSE